MQSLKLFNVGFYNGGWVNLAVLARTKWHAMAKARKYWESQGLYPATATEQRVACHNTDVVTPGEPNVPGFTSVWVVAYGAHSNRKRSFSGKDRVDVGNNFLERYGDRFGGDFTARLYYKKVLL